MVFPGNLVAHVLGCSHPHEVLVLANWTDAPQLLDLGPESLPPLMTETLEELGAVKQLFGNL